MRKKNKPLIGTRMIILWQFGQEINPLFGTRMIILWQFGDLVVKILEKFVYRFFFSVGC
jgi:hypothetical protein